MKDEQLRKRSKLFLVVGEMAALGAASVILLVFLASTLDGYLIQNGQGAAVISAILADLTNTDRGVNSMSELTVSPTLIAIAQTKANDMAQKGYFAHVSPEGKNPWYWFAQGGYKFAYAGENLAVDFSDSADVERAWMNSPTHRANILNSHFTQIGIATAVGTFEGRQTTFVVQEFGTPAHTEQAATAIAIEDMTHTPSSSEIAIARTVETHKKTLALAPRVPSVIPSQARPASTTASTSEVLGSSAEGISAPERTSTQDLWNVFAASPRTTLRYAYYLFGLLILIALIIETGIEFKRHHKRHVLLVLGLLVLMSVLFLSADAFVFTDPILTQGAASLTL